MFVLWSKAPDLFSIPKIPLNSVGSEGWAGAQGTVSDTVIQT